MADDKEEVVESPEIHFEPLVSLPPVEIKTLEEDEQCLFKMRAKLFRYDSSAEPPEWKERGLGDVKVLKHKVRGTCRILMRREKTLKIRCNHYVMPNMDLKPNCGSDRAWVWSTSSDFADEESKPELLAIRFANAENAQKFKEAFEEAQKIMKETQADICDPAKLCKDDKKEEKSEKTKDETNSVTEKLGEMSVKESKSEKSSTEKKTEEVKDPTDKKESAES